MSFTLDDLMRLADALRGGGLIISQKQHQEDASSPWEVGKIYFEWLMEARANGGAPDLVYDDRGCVVAMWRSEGVPCFQVAPGAF